MPRLRLAWPRCFICWFLLRVATRSPVIVQYVTMASKGNFVYILDYVPPAPKSHKYDAGTDLWISINTLPTFRSGNEHNANAGTVGNKIYVLGGLSAPGASIKNEVYDTTTDTWATKAVCPHGRAGAAMVSKFGKIFVAGGYTLLASAHIYSPLTDSWATRAPATRTHPAPSADRRSFRFASLSAASV